MAFPVEFIDRLKSANPIADVVGTYLTLKRSGRDYVCICPFHDEKTASCYIHPNEAYFHCFGCGAGGDVITFTMRYNNLDYVEAVKFLAERGGLTMPNDNFSEAKSANKRKRIFEMNKKAARFFYDQLKTPEGQTCLEYLAKRGLTISTIKKYGMGFAPNSWSKLKSYMLSEGYSEQELIEASLITHSADNSRNTFDFFVFRAMFPFLDLRGNIVGFGGRALSVDDKRKYLNSKNTPVYAKERFLFSMNFAKDVSVKSKKILLCEGNLDVISLNQAGFENAVASCGTALTSEQARMISNYADEAVICYDSDVAGQKATRKAIGILREQGLKVSVVRMDGAKDPDEFINKFGKAKFEHILEKAVDSVSFELLDAQGALDLSNEVGKTDYMKRACEVLVRIKSPIERDIYISKVAREQDVSKEAVEEQVRIMIEVEKKKKAEKKKQEALNFSSKRDPLNPDAALHPREDRAEKALIYYLYNNPDKCGYLLSRITPDKFVTDLNARIYGSLTAKLKAGEDYSFSSFYSEFSPEQVDRIVAIISDFSDEGIDANVAEDCIKVLLDFEQTMQQSSGDDLSIDDLQSLIESLRNKDQ
ncbi:MAG: DNA primase [Ruminococcus sp.]|nr:DNA primase [Ruminococcus sp.]